MTPPQPDAGFRRYVGYSVGEADADASAEADAVADPEASADGEPDADADADADPDGAADTEGVGTAVGSGTKRDGIWRAERTKISTKMPPTMSSHGRARRSSRVGSAPR